VKLKPEWLVWLALAGGMLVRLQLAFSDDGIYWPDEVYQSLEPAHRLVFGYGYVPWEFIDGARNWALPGLVAFIFWLAKLLGLGSPHQYLGLARIAFSAASVGCAYGGWRLAKACGARDWPAAVGAAAAALYALGLYFGHRAMSENASALTVILGLWLLVEDGARRRRLTGASLLGVSVLLRLQCGLFCVAALAWLLARRQWKKALETFGVLCAWAFVFGLLDHLTWADAPGARFGGWFHSAFKYLETNLVQNVGARWGTADASYYFATLFGAMPALAVVLAVGALLSVRKAPLVLASALVFLVAHVFVPHKELRFLLPMLPLLFPLAAAGFSQLPAGKVTAVALAALGLSAGWSLVRARSLTFGDLGAYADRPTVSAWDDFGPINRLLINAGQREDLCGIRVPAHLAWVGGYSYLHKNVPLYMPNQPPQLGHFNYAIAPSPTGLPPLAQDGPYELVKIAEGCVPDPGFSWRLP